MRQLRTRNRVLQFEQLMDRRMLAEIQWIGGISDDWHIGGNWNTGAIPANGDTAVFHGPSAVKLYANQVNNVTLSFRSSTTTLALNNFDFTYRDLLVGEADVAAIAAATITGPGRLLSGNPLTNIVVGVGKAGASLTLNGLDDVVFTQMLIGAHGAPAITAIHYSTVHGQDIVVGRLQIAEGVDRSELDIVNSQGALSRDLVVGYRGEAGANIESSVLQCANSVWVGAGGEIDPPQPVTQWADGELSITGSELVAGEMRIGTYSKGDVFINGQSAVDISGDTIVGDAGKPDRAEEPGGEAEPVFDTLTVSGGQTSLRSGDFIVANSGSSSKGQVWIESGALVRVEGVAIVANSGTGYVDVEGGGTEGLPYFNVGQMRIGEFGSAVGQLTVKDSGQVIVTSEERITGFDPSMFVGIGGAGHLWVENAADVEIEIDLAIGVWQHTTAPARVTILDAEVIVHNDVFNPVRRAKVRIEGASAKLKDRNKEFGKTGAIELRVKDGALAQSSDWIRIGGHGDASLVELYSGGVLQTDETATIVASTTLQGDSSVVASVAAVSLSDSVVIEPGPEGGGVATLTFETPEFDASAGMTLVVDAPSPSSTDHVHMTGECSIGGIMAVNVGDAPDPWTSIGGVGDWMHVLSAVETLVGTFDEVFLPDIGRLNLPPPINGAGYGYEWRVVYDRDDVTPDSLLLQSHPSFTNQPWLGNGTKDVVIVIREIAYEPVANPDQYTVNSNTGSVLEVDAPGLLANDAYAQATQYVFNSGPAHGSLTFHSDGSFEYTPTEGYSGPDSFQYRAVNTIRGVASLPADVTITVTFYPPSGVGDFYSFTSDFGGFLDVVAPGVLTNDSYADSAALVPNSGPSNGSLTFNSDGSFVYVPFVPYNGTDYFQYVAIDSGTSNQSAPVTVEIQSMSMYGLMLDQPAIDSDAPHIAAADIGPLAREAIRRWRQAGVDDEALAARLANLQFVIADLPGSHLGATLGGGRIIIDVDAAGYGWFVDATLGDDGEFSRVVSASQRQAIRGSAVDRADLLTVVMHEIGHVLGLDHEHVARSGDATNLMNDTIGLGMRRNPTAWDAAIVDYLYWQSRRRR